MRKGPGQEAKLGYGAHALMENRNGLLVDLLVSQAAGSAERAAAEKMIKRQRQKGVKVKSLGADKGYDTQDFVKFLRRRKILPHVAANTRRPRRLGYRRSYHAPSELRCQSTDSKESRRDLRLDEDSGRI